MTAKKKLAPVHPGKFAGRIHEAFGLSQTGGRDLASPRRINEIVHGKRSVTADTALRLSRYFGTSGFGSPADYDLDVASDLGKMPEVGFSLRPGDIASPSSKKGATQRVAPTYGVGDGGLGEGAGALEPLAPSPMLS